VAEWRGGPVLGNHGQRRRDDHSCVEVADLMLYGRDVERSAITALLDGARAARGGVLVLRGGPGAGKSVLLDDAVAAAAGMRVLRATGVESEFELPFAALHQLFRPVLSYMDRLPAPQASALGIAFGLMANGKDTRFLVSLAALGMLDELARASPVLCVIDDAQWLDMRRPLLLSLWPVGWTRTG
jgi:predicted ATP-dependent serine protease